MQPRRDRGVRCSRLFDIQSSVIICKALRLESMEAHMPCPDVVAWVIEVDHAGFRLVSPQDVDGLNLKLLWNREIRLVRPIAELAADILDRKSTRLNSSHTVISYAVFCL